MKKIQFSKLLIIFETLLVGYTTYEGFSLARLCIQSCLDAQLPWIVTLVSCAWAAYGTSAVYYYKKSLAENTKGGIVYDSAFTEEPLSSEQEDFGVL